MMKRTCLGCKALVLGDDPPTCSLGYPQAYSYPSGAEYYVRPAGPVECPKPTNYSSLLFWQNQPRQP